MMKRRLNVSFRHLQKWDKLPFEDWPVKFRAVSANADGIVNSGILWDGRYFARKWQWVDGVITSLGLHFEK